MPSLRRLNGVAHDLAAHSQSGLSWLHPHLAEACRAIGVLTVNVDLLDADPYPARLPSSTPLRLAIGALREWFEANLATQGFSRVDLRRVDLRFSFRAGGDDFDSAVEATLVDRSGKTHVGNAGFILPYP